MGGLASLRIRLALLVLFAALPAFGVLLHSATEQRRQALEDTKTEALRFVRVAAIQQRELMSTTRTLLLNLADRSVAQAPHSERCSEALRRLLAQHPTYANLGIATHDGQLVCSALSLSRPVNVSDRSYFRAALTERTLTMGEYQIGRVTHKAAINFAYPVVNASGRVRGVVFAALDLSWLKHLMSQLDLPAGASLTVIDNHKTVLARYPDADDQTGRVFHESALINTITQHTGEGTVESPGFDGIERIYAFSPLFITPRSQAYIAFGIPKSTAFAAANRSFVHNIAILGIVTLLALIGAWVGGNALVVHPVHTLIGFARRLQAGDLAARAGLPAGGGEIGSLAHAFDEMAGTLEARQQELARVDRALRTLSAGNRALIRAQSEHALLHDMCVAISEAGRYPCVWVAYLDNEAPLRLRPVAHVGLKEVIIAELSERGCVPVQEAVRSGVPYLLSKTNVPLPWSSVLALPLPVGGSMVGVLVICTDEAWAFGAGAIDLLRESADDLAFGISTLRARVKHEEANEAIRRMAYFDALTGLPSSTQMEMRLQSIIEARQDYSLVALLMVDIDRFRDINDTLGFEQGNRLLKEIGSRLQGALPQALLIARMRADEFAVLLSIGDTDDALTAVRRITEALNAPIVLEGIALDMRATVGIACAPAHGRTASEIIRRADIAIRHAKKSAVECALYAPERDDATPRRLSLAGALRRAIDDGELLLHYQPKVDAKTGRLCGAEALVRWQHPDHGLVHPAEFISIAEHTGLIKPLTYWVIEAALHQAVAWHHQHRPLPLAVNLSARNLRDPALLDRIQILLEKSGAKPQWLEIELTESALMDDPTGALEVLTRLHELGIALFVDDFGTGYSSLSYLNKLPVDAIKIDKSFVSELATDGEAATIVRSTIQLAHDLGLKVVAEGVENQPIYDSLMEMGCDVLQGYHIGKPLPRDGFESMLKRII